MIKNWEVLHDVQAKIKLLTPEERLYLAQRIIGDISREHFVDHEALRRAAEEMANDPDMQRVMRGDDLPGLAAAYGFVEPKDERAAS